MKINLYLSGGAFMPPFAVYQPLAASEPVAPQLASHQKSEDKGNQALLNSVYSAIKDLDGLPGDMDAASSTLASLLARILDNANNMLDGNLYFNTAQISYDYLKIMGLIKKIKGSKANFEEAKKTSVDNGGIHEAAIDSLGRVVTISNEGFAWKSPEEIKANPKKYRVLTNAELLDYRYEGLGGLAFNDTVVNLVLHNSTGMPKIMDLINAAIKDLGTDVESNNYYVRTHSGELLQGLKDFEKVIKLKNGSGDVYDTTILNESQKRLMQQSLYWLYGHLDNTSRSLLKMKSRTGTDEEAIAVMSNLIASRTSNKIQFKADLEDSSSSDTSDLKQSFVANVLAGTGGREGTFTIDTGKGAMKADGTIYEEIKTLQGNHQPASTVATALNNSGLRSIIDSSAGFYFGAQKMDIYDIDHISYDGTGLLRINLPVVSQDSKMPNFNLLELFLEADTLAKAKIKEIENKGGTPNENLIYQEVLGDPKFKPLSSLYDAKGNPIKEKFAQFIVMNGVASETGITSLQESEIVEKNKYIAETEHTPYILNLLTLTLKLGPDKDSPSIEIDSPSPWRPWDWGWANLYDKIYKGAIYIPIINNKAAAATGANSNISVKQNKILEGDYQRYQDVSKLTESL